MDVEAQTSKIRKKRPMIIPPLGLCRQRVRMWQLEDGFGGEIGMRRR